MIIKMKVQTCDSIFKRSLKGTGDLANLVYNDVLLLHESSEINKLKGVDITKKEILKSNISAVHHNLTKYRSFFYKKKNLHWYVKNTIEVQKLENQIFYVSSTPLIISLLRHLRNAFAHNLLVLDHDYIIMGDFDGKNNKPDFNCPTMLGRISIENFKLLVETIKSSTKN